jgi:hypothetical protein
MRPARALPVVWLIGAVPLGVLGYVTFALSETSSDRRVGVVLTVLAGGGLLVGLLLALRPSDGLVRASLLVSLLWALGAVVAFVGMDFAQDRLLLAGLPAALALVSAALALRRLGA